jgi:hypothetical protein
MPPVSYIVTGSKAVRETGALTRTVPPVLTAAPLDGAADAEVELDVPPQAASNAPAALAESPKTDARISS